jgi:hypothetical protein
MRPDPALGVCCIIAGILLGPLLQLQTRKMRSGALYGKIKHGSVLLPDATLMERYYTCVNGHSFQVMGEGNEPDPDATAEVYFTVECPHCKTSHEIQWPSNRAFAIAAK